MRLQTGFKVCPVCRRAAALRRARCSRCGSPYLEGWVPTGQTQVFRRRPPAPAWPAWWPPPVGPAVEPGGSPVSALPASRRPVRRDPVLLVTTSLTLLLLTALLWRTAAPPPAAVTPVTASIATRRS